MNCIYCGKSTGNPKFCSRSCSASFSNRASPKRKLTRTCSKCTGKVKSYRHSLCEEHWQDYKANKLDNRTLGEVIYKQHHKSSAFALVRASARAKYKKIPCENCGYEKHTEVCHIKPIADFHTDTLLSEINSLDNLIRLCPNCHWEMDNSNKDS